MQTRYYDAEVGRFLNADDICYIALDMINGCNIYAYCMNNPVMFVDPSGHFLISALIIGGIIGAAVGFGVAAYIDYSDDGSLFNGSVAWYDYVGATVVGGVVGATLGALATTSITSTIPTGLGLVQTTVGTTAVVVTSTATVTIAGAQVIAGVATAGTLVLMAEIGKSGGYKISHHYPNDHQPPHVHVDGGKFRTKVDLNGNPLRGQKPLDYGGRKAFWNLYEKILEALKPWM